MAPTELLLEGFELMLFGLGSVFLFLILLIGCIRLMAYVVGHFDNGSVDQATVITPATAVEADADIIAAVQAAIHLHRARRAG